MTTKVPTVYFLFSFLLYLAFNLVYWLIKPTELHDIVSMYLVENKTELLLLSYVKE